MLHSFNDFEAWGDAVRGADLRLVCDRVKQPLWQLATVRVGEVEVQVAYEGAGNASYGVNTHAGPILFLPMTHGGQHVANGESLDGGACFLSPPGGDFSIAVKDCAHAWCSIASPPGSLAALQGCGGGDRHEAFSGPSRVLRSPLAATKRLRELISAVAGADLFSMPHGPAHAAAARQLLASAAACLPAATVAPAPIGRPRLDRRRIIGCTMALIDADADKRTTVAELAARVGVTQRTLVRVFHDSLGMSPRQYLSLRLLHGVRRSLRQADPDGTTVSRVLVGHGIWEFGRFAVRYRRHFGETLSATLCRSITPGTEG